LVDALVDGFAVSIDCILLASNTFRDNLSGFVSKEAINCLGWISNEAEATGLQLLQAGNAINNWDNIFFKTIVRRGVVSSCCVCVSNCANGAIVIFKNNNSRSVCCMISIKNKLSRAFAVIRSN